MPNKIFLKSFEDFRGISYQLSDLTLDNKFFRDLQNYRRSLGNSLRGRSGFQIVGQKGKFVGLHEHNFASLTTGATVQQLITINENFWRLASGELVVTRTAGSTSVDWNLKLDFATATFRFVLNQGGAPVTLTHPVTGEANPYLDLGNGLEEEQTPTNFPTTGLITLLDLQQAIDNTANFSCAAIAATARVNGNQSGVTTITVDAGHTVVQRSLLYFWDHLTDTLTVRIVLSVTATTITFDTSFPAVDVLDNQVLGIGAAPAAGIYTRPTSVGTTTNPQNVTYWYWEWIPHNMHPRNKIGNTLSNFFPLEQYWANRTLVQNTKPSFLSANRAAYIAAKSANSTTVTPFTNSVWKYDGQAAYRAGVPAFKGSHLLTAFLAAGALTGLYKWAFRYVYKDKNGIEYAGTSSLSHPYYLWEVGQQLAAQQCTIAIPLAPFCVEADKIAKVNGAQVGVITITVDAGFKLKAGDYIYFIDRSTTAPTFRQITSTGATTITISGGVVNVSDDDLLVKDANLLYNLGGARVNGAQNNVRTVTVFDRHNIFVGDIIFFYDAKRARYTERTITGVTDTTVAWDVSEDDVNVTANAYFVKNFKIEIYRTKANGDIYYLLDTVQNYPDIYDDIYCLYADNTLDSALQIPLDAPDPSELIDDDPPPKCGLIASHQGLNVFADIENQPNTIAFSKSDNIEGVPVASHYFDVPSQIGGAISAIASDNDDRLAAFKPTAYYDISGDLDALAFSIRAVAEGDYGISSQASIAKIRGALLGVGPSGPIAVKNGVLNTDFGFDVRPLLQGNRDNLIFEAAVAINDYTKEIYQLYIPSGTNGPNGSIAFSSLGHLIYQYKNQKEMWANWSFDLTNFQNIAGYGIVSVQSYEGSVVRNRTLLHYLIGANASSMQGRVVRELDESFDTFAYCDNHLAIPYGIRTVFEHLGEPSINKQFTWVKAYCLYPIPEDSLAVNFQFLVNTYRNFTQTSADSTFTWTFQGSSPLEQKGKFKIMKMRSVQLYLVTNALGQCPQLTGLEYITEANYKGDVFD